MFGSSRRYGRAANTVRPPFYLIGGVMLLEQIPLDDATRERLISLYVKKLSTAFTIEQKIRYWTVLEQLINGRSPAQIKLMEDEIV